MRIEFANKVSKLFEGELRVFKSSEKVSPKEFKTEEEALEAWSELDGVENVWGERMDMGGRWWKTS